MSARLLSGSIAAPGFNGLNSQDSSVLLDSGWALEASNCVIDKYGRIGARKGWQYVTAMASPPTINSIYEFKDTAGNYTYLSAGNLKLYKSTSNVTLTDATPASYTVTGNNWQFTSLPDGQGVDSTAVGFAAQASHSMLVYNYNNSGTFQKLSAVGSEPAGFALDTFNPSVAIAGYGRVWSAATTTNKTTVFYSVLLEGVDYQGAGAGVLDVSAVVGNNDEITSLAVHNNFLIVFCKNNIVVYANANDADNLALSDVIKGIGCIHHNTVQSTGTDVIFMSKTGLRALSRTVQEKSMPMREISLNIRDDLVSWINGENLSNIRSVYYPTDAFYLLTLPTLQRIVCFDMKSPAPNGAAKVTVWDSSTHKAFCVTESNDLLLGQTNGIAKYYGYNDNSVAYRLKYYTNYFDLGSPTTLKMLKRIGTTVVGGSDDFHIKFGFDYSGNYRSLPLVLTDPPGTSEYGVAEYGIAEYSGENASQKVAVNAGGSGTVLQLGFEADINGSPISIQKIDVAVVTGKSIV